MLKKLKRVSVYPNFRYTCLHCGQRFMTYEHPAYADLNGEPFQAYYCEPCVNVMPSNQIEGGDPCLD